MRFFGVLLVLVLITPFSAHGATSTLMFHEDSSTEGDVVEISWQPEAGTYRITAERLDEDGRIVGSETKTFVVKPLPPPATPEVQGTSTTEVESSAQIQESIANIVPQASAAAPVFEAIDTLRQRGVEALEAGEAWAEGKARAPKSEVAGESIEEAPAGSGIAAMVMQFVATLLLYVFGALKFVLSNAGIFYPVFAIAFFYLLWRLFKRMRRT